MKYAGELNKPIARKKIGLLASDDAIQSEAARIVTAKWDKLPALFAAHGIQDGDFLGLAFALAGESVPGFRVVDPAGRPTEWMDYDKAEFKLAVDDMRVTNPKLSISEAIRRVQRLSKWAGKTKGMKVTALSKHYYSADDRYVQMMRDANSYRELLAQED